jgi:hypothetical protein
MESQNYSNHAKVVPMFHYVLFGMIALTLIGSLVNLTQAVRVHQGLYSAALIVVLTVCSLFLFYYCRIFSLRAQDRAIRAEESLRHFVLTGKLPDSRLTMSQMIGLRFASDAELAELARKAVETNMTRDAIKKAVKNWRADHHRV